jgi:hypothetical protein
MKSASNFSAKSEIYSSSTTDDGASTGKEATEKWWSILQAVAAQIPLEGRNT